MDATAIRIGEGTQRWMSEENVGMQGIEMITIHRAATTREDQGVHPEGSAGTRVPIQKEHLVRFSTGSCPENTGMTWPRNRLDLPS